MQSDKRVWVDSLAIKVKVMQSYMGVIQSGFEVMQSYDAHD